MTGKNWKKWEIEETIGKIGKRFLENNNNVIFAACDTFRAAAIEQLEEWAKKINVETVKSVAGSDPASVAYKATEFEKLNEQLDVVNKDIEMSSCSNKKLRKL